MDSIVSGITEDEAAALSQLLDKLRGANSSDASPFSQVISE
jgi:hypothetical protein